MFTRRAGTGGAAEDPRVTGLRRMRMLATLRNSDPSVHWDRLLFSAKESVYKAWFPLARKWLGFEEADVVFRPDGTFSAELIGTSTSVPDGTEITGFDGRWLARDGLAITAIAR